MPIVPNPNLQADLKMVALDPPPVNAKAEDGRRQESCGPVLVSHAQRLQEFLLVLAICNTVVVSRHAHHDSVS